MIPFAMLQLLVIVAIIAFFIVIGHVRRQPTEKRNPLIIRYTLYGALVIIIGLVVTGRMHWLAAPIAAVLPVIQRLLPWVIRFLPFMKKQQVKQDPPNPTSNDKMDLSQALRIFGFDKVPDKETITQRHRELIHKNHPDRGGSDYIAAQINEARDVLVNAQKS
jgi:DnaJ family protein C protein 19